MPSVSRDHGGGSGILGQNNFRSKKKECILGSLRPHSSCFREVAQVLQVILAVHEATSGAASTKVADLEAAPEVSNTKSLQDELEPTI